MGLLAKQHNAPFVFFETASVLELHHKNV